MKFSILLPTYREKERISKLIKILLQDKLSKNIEKIVVVTPDEIFLPKSKKILVLKEKERRGKSHAIRLGIKHIKTSLVVLLSSDIIMKKDFLETLFEHFKNHKVGMVVGRVKADRNSRIYKFSKIIWDLHHLLCLNEPKGTEIVAFRKIFKHFPFVSADEVFIEYKIRKAGYVVVYEPRVFGYTKIPYTLFQFFRQRKRSFNGHLEIKKKYKFKTSSMKIGLLIKILFEYLKEEHSMFNFFNLLVVTFIEVFARIFALIDALKGNYERIWKRV
jgi:cellulose synthase/poly-beta-1,6-N-acetylglucosamine synthase-like glycosyltransferase